MNPNSLTIQAMEQQIVATEKELHECRERYARLNAQLEEATKELALSSPAAWAIQREAEENGPHAALAEALKFLLDAHSTLDSADRKMREAEQAQEAANAVQAEAMAAKARYSDQYERYVDGLSARTVETEALQAQVNRLERVGENIDVAWPVQGFLLVLALVLAGIAAWPVAEGWFW